LKTVRWGSSLVQEKYQEEKVCDKKHPYRIIIIIIIIITIIINITAACEQLASTEYAKRRDGVANLSTRNWQKQLN